MHFHMTVIYVEHIETCQQGDKSINTRVIYWKWYNKKLFFLCQTLVKHNKDHSV